MVIYMQDELMKNFYNVIKEELNSRWFVKKEFIYKLIESFNYNYSKIDYTKIIKNPIEIALLFYKDYNIKYYNMIMSGIKSGKIIINYNKDKSYTSENDKKSILSLTGKDSDVFVIVHEFAHFIDINSIPRIIKQEYSFLSEVFSFYMEKRFERFLSNIGYDELINIREKNRLYYESNMLKVIDNYLDMRNLFVKNGHIDNNDENINKIKDILKYQTSDIVNYLLRYPIANILSSYIIKKDLISNDYDLVKICMSIDLYEALESFIGSKCIK